MDDDSRTDRAPRRQDEAGSRPLSDLGLVPEGGRPGTPDVPVTGLALSSRAVEPGHLFAALPGSTTHGARFAADALARGAAAILTDAEGAAMIRAEGGVPPDRALIVSADPRRNLAHAAARWFARQPGHVVAVTGTNGKTSVASFTRQLWELAGLTAVNIGTTGIEGSWSVPLGHTTPDPITLHRHLAKMADAGVDLAAMEASSHGLDQRRLDGVRLAAGAFTTFSQDHLDYHRDFDAYFAAKMRLFDTLLPEGSQAIVNLDDAKGEDVAARARRRGLDVVSLGHDPAADLVILDQRFEEDGQKVRFAWRGRVQMARLGLVGGFQALNALTAALLAASAGDITAEEAFALLPRLRTVRGRMEEVARRVHGAPIFVDYAHTPDALATALAALRPHVMGRLVVVFGAGGDRDRTKRPLMGRAAAEGADVVILTDDNPRSEDPAAIRADIRAGCPEALEIPDRAEAILKAVALLAPGDALLIAGKGHESGQIVGDVTYPFNDAEQASLAVAAIEGREP